MSRFTRVWLGGAGALVVLFGFALTASGWDPFDKLDGKSNKHFDPQGRYCNMPLERLKANPTSLKCGSVEIVTILNKLDNVWAPFYTPFSPEEYLSFSVWGERQPIWHKDQRVDDHPFFYIRKDSEELNTLIQADRYAVLRLQGIVRSDFDGHAWVEVMHVLPVDSRRLNDRVLKNLILGYDHLTAARYDQAIVHYRHAFKTNLPEYSKALAYKEYARALYASGDFKGARDAAEYSRRTLKTDDEVELLWRESKEAVQRREMTEWKRAQLERGADPAALERQAPQGTMPEPSKDEPAKEGDHPSGSSSDLPQDEDMDAAVPTSAPAPKKTSAAPANEPVWENLDNATADLIERADSLRDGLDVTRTALVAAEERAEELARSLDEAKRAILEREVRLASQTARVRELESRLSQAHRTASVEPAAVEAMTNANLDLQRAVTEREARLAELDRTVRQAREENDSLRSDVLSLQAQVSQGRETARFGEELQALHREDQVRIEALEEQLKTLQLENESLRFRAERAITPVGPGASPAIERPVRTLGTQVDRQWAERSATVLRSRHDAAAGIESFSTALVQDAFQR